MKIGFSGLGGQGVRNGPFEGDFAFMFFISLLSISPIFLFFLKNCCFFKIVFLPNLFHG